MSSKENRATCAARRPDRKAFTDREWRLIRRLRTPAAVQAFLRRIPYNFERDRKSCRSFRGVLESGMAHCLEGALAAAVILEQHGHPPLLMSFESQDKLDHVLLLYRVNGRWGSVARSRDPGLHGRKPVFRRIRDLACSYLDEYVDLSGRITAYGVGDPRTLGACDWRLSRRNVWKVENYLIEMPHRPLRMSERRYQRALRKYRRFKARYPDCRPDYFPTRPLWL